MKDSDNSKPSQPKGLLTLLITISSLLILAFLVWKIPEWYYADWALAIDLKTAELLKTQNDLRTILVQAIGGVAIVFGAYFTWKNLNMTREIAERNLQISQQTLSMSEGGQISDSFTRAIEQLGNKVSLEIRLGGIYALERIAKDSENDHLPIMEILTAYVRENAAWQDPPKPLLPLAKDIQAILTIMGRRTRSYEKGKGVYLDLRATDLRDAYLSLAHFENAVFYGAHLERAMFVGAHLEGASFIGAHLDGANFSDADLEDTNFYTAHLDDAIFNISRARGATFVFAELGKTSFVNGGLEKASFLHANAKGADFTTASLTGASFMNASLEEADFTGAFMDEVDLVGATIKDATVDQATLTTARGITLEAIMSTFGYGTAHLPDHLRRAIENVEQARNV